MTAPIVARELFKAFGDFVAVDSVSFTVERGEVYGWLGPNGAGKTTTIRMLLGLLQPTSGEARVLGFNPATQAKAMHAHVGYMSQLFTLYNDLTVNENIRFYGQAYGLDRRQLRRRRAEIVEMAGLQGREKELTANLSGGWKQRLALGCAIIHNPQVIFLDEPTAGVDPISRREFWELIYVMVQEGVTILVTTHYMDEAELCQRVGFISQGRLIALDAPDRLKESQMWGQVLEIGTDDANEAMRVLKAAQASGCLSCDEVALYGAQVHVVVGDKDIGDEDVGDEDVGDAQSAKALIVALLQNNQVKVNSAEWITPTLEDVFIAAVRPGSEPRRRGGHEGRVKL